MISLRQFPAGVDACGRDLLPLDQGGPAWTANAISIASAAGIADREFTCHAASHRQEVIWEERSSHAVEPSKHGRGSRRIGSRDLSTCCEGWADAPIWGRRARRKSSSIAE